MRTFPDTASVRPKSAARHCLGPLLQSRILLMMLRHWHLSLELVQEGVEEEQKDLIAALVAEVVLDFP